jgi:hypothetical protein
MGMTNALRDYWAQVTIGEAVTAFSNANARIGAGDSSTAFAATQTDLQAATNKFRKGMEATYPQRSGNVLTFRSLFATGEANFDWNEWGIFNAASGGVMMTRKVESMGTKTSVQSFQLTLTITVNAG